MDFIIPDISKDINSVDISIKSLIDFVDNRVIKQLQKFLKELENSFVVYRSQTSNHIIKQTPDQFQKVKTAYEKLNDSINRFLGRIIKDYLALLPEGYKIKMVYEMLNNYSNKINELKRKNDVDELKNVTNQVSQVTPKLEKLIAHYNQELSKLNFLQSNFRNKMIIYQSLSAEETFSISFEEFIKELDSLSVFKNPKIKEKILGKLLQEFPLQSQPISEEPPLELLTVRQMNPQILNPEVPISHKTVDVTYSLLEPYSRKVLDPAYREHQFVGSDDTESPDTGESQEGQHEYLSEEKEMAMAAQETREEDISEENTTSPSSVMTQSSGEPIDTEMPSTSGGYGEHAEQLLVSPEISVGQEYQKQLSDLLNDVKVDKQLPEEIAIDNHQQITHEFFLNTFNSLEEQISELNNREDEIVRKTKMLQKTIKDLKKLLETGQRQTKIDRYQNELRLALKNLIQLGKDDEEIQQTKHKLFEVERKLFEKWQNELERNAQILTSESDRVMEYEGQSGSPLEKLEEDKSKLIRMKDFLNEEVDRTIDFYTERKVERDMYLNKETSLLKEA